MNEEKYIYLVFPSVIGLKILNSILFELCSNLNSNYSLSKSSHLILYILLLVLPTQKALSNDKVDYFKDILPIFEQNCLQCHGPDKQKSDLRVDLRNSLIESSLASDKKKAEKLLADCEYTEKRKKSIRIGVIQQKV